MNRKYVAYYRVSTSRQGISGLGMDAQKNAVSRFLNDGNATLVAEFSEVESGRNTSRLELQKAVALCRKAKATLLIAKLDRLARNAAFLLNLRDSGVDFLAVDMPHADKFTVGIMALLAEKERDLISERTKAGLAAAKRRGTRLGNPNPAQSLKAAVKESSARAALFRERMRPVVNQIRKAGVNSLRQIAVCLNARGLKTVNGREFKAQTVKDVISRR
jgi:DNA invertase Pin-like site-specific DNA recombinase